jgi:ankyrin repeat protein
VSTENFAGDRWYYAARTSDIAAMQDMISKGRNVDSTTSTGMTALMTASRAGSPQTVKWLIEQGAVASKLDKDDQSALVYALTGNTKGLKLEQTVDELIKAGADPFKIDKVGFQPVQEMLELDLDAQIMKLKFTDKKPCDLLPPRKIEVPISTAARRMEKIKIAEFLEAQGCW